MEELGVVEERFHPYPLRGHKRFGDSSLGATYGFIGDDRMPANGSVLINVTTLTDIGLKGIQTLGSAIDDYYVTKARITVREFGVLYTVADRLGKQILEIGSNRCFLKEILLDRTYRTNEVTVELLEWGGGDGIYGGAGIRFSLLGCRVGV